MEAYENEVKEILENLYSESDYIDYKVDPYSFKGKPFNADKKREMLKDVVAMANVKLAPSQYRFIIFGVSDWKQLIGIHKDDWPDDSTFQGLISHINGNLKVNTGVVSFKKKEFGYFCITPECNLVYCVTGPCKFDPENIIVGKYFVRRGSTTDVLSDIECQKIRNLVDKSISDEYQIKEDIRQQGKVLALAAVFGCWNEKRPGDKEIIKICTGSSYDSWIQILQKQVCYEASNIKVENGIWQIYERKVLLEKYGHLLFDQDFDRLQSGIEKLYFTINEKYNQPSKERWYYSNAAKYSDALLGGVSEFLAIAGNNKNLFPSASDGKSDRLIEFILRQIFDSKKWQVFATIKCGVSFLAEANPELFISLVLGRLQSGNNAFCQYLMEKDEGICNIVNYGDEYIWALKKLAVSKKFFGMACKALFDLAAIKGESLNALREILLPWYPMTALSITARTNIFKTLWKDNEERAWSLLYDLLPKFHDSSSSIEYPLYIPCQKIEHPSTEDIHKAGINYEKMAIIHAAGHIERLKKLCELFVRVWIECFPDFCDLLVAESKKEYTDEERYSIWNKLLSEVNRYNRESVLPPSVKNKLEGIAELWKPQNTVYQVKRVFEENVFSLFPDESDMQHARDKVEREKQQELSRLYKEKGKDGIVALVKCINHPAYVGNAFAQLNQHLSSKDIVELLGSKDTKLYTFVDGYIRELYFKNADEAQSLFDESWSREVQLQFFLAMPLNKRCWEMAERILQPEDLKRYWKEHEEAYSLDSVEEYDYAIKHFLYSGSWHKALFMANTGLYRGKPISLACIEQILLDNEASEDEVKFAEAYEIKELYHYIESRETNRNILLIAAWKWFSFLRDDAHIIFELLAETPRFFVSILAMCFKTTHRAELGLSEITESMTSNGCRILHEWKLVPGFKDGVFDLDRFYSWYKEAIKLCTKYGLLVPGSQYIGKVLFHALGTYGDFCLPELLAEFLNENNNPDIRKGFEIEAFNSVGVHFIDQEATEVMKLVKDYENKAEAADEKGFIVLGSIFRDIANQLKKEALDEKRGYGLRKQGIY